MTSRNGIILSSITAAAVGSLLTMVIQKVVLHFTKGWRTSIHCSFIPTVHSTSRVCTVMRRRRGLKPSASLSSGASESLGGPSSSRTRGSSTPHVDLNDGILAASYLTPATSARAAPAVVIKAEVHTQTNRHWFTDDSATQTCVLDIQAASLTEFTFPAAEQSHTRLSESSYNQSPCGDQERIPSILISQAEYQLSLLMKEVNDDPANPRSWMSLYAFLRELPHRALLEIIEGSTLPELLAARADKRDYQLLLEPLEKQILAALVGTPFPEKERFEWSGASIVQVNGKTECHKCFREYLISESEDDEFTTVARDSERLLMVVQKYKYLCTPGKWVQFPEEQVDTSLNGSMCVPGLSGGVRSFENDSFCASPTSKPTIQSLVDSIFSLRSQDSFQLLQRTATLCDFAEDFNKICSAAMHLNLTPSPPQRFEGGGLPEFMPHLALKPSCRIAGGSDSAFTHSEREPSPCPSSDALPRAKVNRTAVDCMISPRRLDSPSRSNSNVFERLYGSPLASSRSASQDMSSKSKRDRWR